MGLAQLMNMENGKTKTATEEAGAQTTRRAGRKQRRRGAGVETSASERAATKVEGPKLEGGARGFIDPAPLEGERAPEDDIERGY